MKRVRDSYLFINIGGTIRHISHNRLLKTQDFKFVYDIGCSCTNMVNWQDESKLTFNRFTSLVEQGSGMKFGDAEVFYFFRGHKIRVRNEVDFHEMKRAFKGNDLDVFVNTSMGYSMKKIINPSNKGGYFCSSACRSSSSFLKKPGVFRFFRTAPCVGSVYRDV